MTTPNRRSHTPARAGRTSAPATLVAVDVPLSDPQEFDFLPLREGRAWKPVEIDRAVRTMRALLDDGDKSAGAYVWRVGDQLLELYNGFPERVKGAPTFTKWAGDTFDLRSEDVSEFLRARNGIENADVAGDLGRRKIQLAVKLLARLGLESIEALEKQELKLPDGRTCHFPATVVQLQGALDVLTGRAPPHEGPSTLHVREKTKARNAVLKKARRAFPQLRTLRMRYVGRGHDVYLETGLVAARQQVPLAKLLLALEAEL